MIVVRILDEGQFALADAARAELEARDARLLDALESNDETAYTAELDRAARRSCARRAPSSPST